MSIEFDIIKEVVKRLDEAGILYMITGSIAANFYSIPRMTRDIDIVIELKKVMWSVYIMPLKRTFILIRIWFLML